MAQTILPAILGQIYRNTQDTWDVSTSQRDSQAVRGTGWLAAQHIAFYLPQKTDLPPPLHKITSQTFSEIVPLMDLLFYVRTVIFHETGEACSERRHVGAALTFEGHIQ